MKLYSWNVNGLRAVIRKGALQEFLHQKKPDVLCLQEIKAKPEQVDYDFEGYKVFWNPAERPGYSGTAILVKQSLAGKISSELLLTPSSFLQRFVFKPSDDVTSSGLRETSVKTTVGSSQCSEETSLPAPVLQEGRILTLEFPDFYLVDVYTPNSKPDLSRLELREQAWDPCFLQYLKALEKTKPVVTCGDFNAAHQEIDLARPDNNHHNAGFTDEERQGVTNLLNAGFVDTFRQLHPDEKRYSWWSFRGNARANNVGWRIDYFFISKDLLPQLQSAEIYNDILGSDHCPISITLDLPEVK